MPGKKHNSKEASSKLRQVDELAPKASWWLMR
jgi:hypothetical protein